MNANNQSTLLVSTVSAPVLDPVYEQVQEGIIGPLYRVIIYNDDVTPYDYVVRILGEVFLLSEELADHVAYTAHKDGIAIVVIRPRSEAERLISIAHAKAKLDGFPLTFTLEAD